MSRPREFDETAALEAAMDCFWRRGYEATSLRDLTTSMGLTAPSLYNAFGGKQELFSRALERYLDRTTRDRLRRLEQSLAPKAALHRFFAEIIEHSISDRQRKGRLLVNSALEIAPHDAECRAVIAEQFTDIEAFFRRCVLKTQADATVSSDVDAGDIARMSHSMPTTPCSANSSGGAASARSRCSRRLTRSSYGAIVCSTASTALHARP
jgi:TetR/AcrR family transcriptional regulator, transcriptional repressor for nem operon